MSSRLQVICMDDDHRCDSIDTACWKCFKFRRYNKSILVFYNQGRQGRTDIRLRPARPVRPPALIFNEWSRYIFYFCKKIIIANVFFYKFLIFLIYSFANLLYEVFSHSLLFFVILYIIRRVSSECHVRHKCHAFSILTLRFSSSKKISYKS